IVTGDITLEQAKEIAQRELGEWSAPANPLTTPAASTLPEVPRPATRVILVNKPGAPQSVIQIGAPGVPRGSEDYAAITLMNTILGGSFSSRLNQILREQRGYTYGARSAFDWEPVPGPFIASSAVRTDATDSSLVVFFRELKRIREEPVSAAELERAKSYVVLGSLGDFETTRQVAGQLASLDAFGLPLSIIPKELATVQTLTAADVQRVARKYIDPEHLTVVVVGDLAKIRPGIEKLGLGPVTVVEPAGGTAVH
ncbi:MAG TPA: pitrilysin family protein, partial [Longimicrobiaceae bacterium]|nr:pitrilysin family protein [Longimicrobiaceae bacterium]